VALDSGWHKEVRLKLVEEYKSQGYRVHSSHDDTPEKTNLELFKPEECLMVGDWPEKDIEGAKALRMKTCLIKHRHLR